MRHSPRECSVKQTLATRDKVTYIRIFTLVDFSPYHRKGSR